MSFSFNIARLPRIEFGPGCLSKLPDIAHRHGRQMLIVTGARSFLDSQHWHALAAGFRERAIKWHSIQIGDEPSPELVDDAVRSLHGTAFDAVIGIGGGSALDAAKAIAGLLKPGNSVMDHLEGVGPELPYRGPATPFIAVPTTAGTGSEATKNAVLSRHGEGGFKKSFRDDRLVAEWAVVDPDLLASCPPAIIAANGMDAFTQLLESYLSTRANPFTDALALSGMEAVRDSLLPWFEGRGDATGQRSRMAYAALLSGITLAQVGLGSVHGLAAPLGAFFPIPHGVACGTLVAGATRTNIAALQERAPDGPALGRYATVGRLLTGQPQPDAASLPALLEVLDDWTRRLDIARLASYGVSEGDIPRIVANSRGSSMKTNPVVLNDDEIARLLRSRL
ncbi:MAG: iron-containing alcohol dehydrogenase [Thiobacillus sp.]|nr:iron-containing alcohol dehydrogenase [Thiobacillus sp.]